MKRPFLFIAVFFLFLSSSSFMPMVVCPGGETVSCDSCTGDLVFSWHCEDVDVTADTPCGCTAGDSEATLNETAAISGSQYNDGDESLYIANATDYATFAISSYDIVDDAEGTITFDIYFTAQDTAVYLFDCYGSATNNMRIRTANSASDELVFNYYSDSNLVSAVTSAANLTTGVWYSVTAKWRQGVTDPSISLSVNGDTGTSNDDLTDPVSDWSVMRAGMFSGSGGTYYIDNLKVYDAWQ